MAWTSDQQEAIEYRNGNLLVSAAAGSGKTAVLVERIIRRVTDEQEPIDIDSIVVVTFTRAAAQEMKSRLGMAFEKALEANPGNRHLLKQLSLIDNARITTIDSFCTYILRNYYNTIDLDPAFRIGDQGELELMKADVFSEIIEEHLSAADSGFDSFVEAFAPGKTIDRLFQIVTGLYNFSQSHPWPEEWLNECRLMYAAADEGQLEELPLVKDTVSYIVKVCKEAVRVYDQLMELCTEPTGPHAYYDTLKAEREQALRLSQCKGFAALAACSNLSFARLKPEKNGDEELKELVKKKRTELKERLLGICADYLSGQESDIIKELSDCRPYVNVYVDLTIEFTRRYKETKKARNIVDFSDVEHYALDILITRENGRETFTEVADELAKGFNEIYIDEYQDSNYVQEKILTAVSGERFGQPDMFMVGDVKQSIYKFRMAKPELFMAKYNSYSSEQGPYRKIELHSNFRSRANVLECINDIFYCNMKDSVGGIEYTDEVRLNPGLPFEGEDYSTDIIYARKNEFTGTEVTAAEICANITAEKIRNVIKEMPGISYRDIVILLRSDKASGPVYASILNDHGIPCVYASTTGYFDTPEITAVMNLLAIIDNPRQEIALASVMRSFFAYFTAEELAMIKGGRRRTNLYDCVCQYSLRENETAHKCMEFLEWINSLRSMADIHTIREMISHIVYDTGYYDYEGLKTGGSVKKTNLDMLVEKAADYEKTSYSGVFNFLRYIEKLRKYDVDNIEGGSPSAEDDVVRIMSIHKSKGLEFPVVIIGDMGKKYNLRDTSDSILFDSTYGIGMDYVDLERRIRKPVTVKKMIARKIRTENIGEEIRVLYVAMTRAVQKLIMVGTVSNSAAADWKSIRELGIMDMSYILEHPDFMDITAPSVNPGVNKGHFVIEQKTADSILNYAAAVLNNKSTQLTHRFAELNPDNVSEDGQKAVSDILEYKYPYADVFSLKTKYSVSELKHKAMEESEELEAEQLVAPPDRSKPVPEFIEKAQVSGTFRGNAYHKVFELLDYGKESSPEAIKEQLMQWIEDKRISDDYAQLIDCNHFSRFLNSLLGQNMGQAYSSGQLFREQPFIMEVDASYIDSSYTSDEKVLVQGIIDAFYFKNNKIYVVDYKTDRVERSTEGERVLIERYKKQLELYCEALTRVTGRELGGCYIYSVHLDKSIELAFQ